MTLWKRVLWWVALCLIAPAGFLILLPPTSPPRVTLWLVSTGIVAVSASVLIWLDRERRRLSHELREGALDALPLEVGKDLTTEWWRDTRPGGVFQSDGEFSDEAWDRAKRVADFLDSQAKNINELPHLIEVLVETAPTKGNIPYIGTWFLENAYPVLGEGVFVALDAAKVSSANRALIRSGFQY